MTLAEQLARFNSPRQSGTRPPVPRLLLVTDQQRLPDPMAAIARLPVGSGVLFRHHECPQRALLARRIARACREKRLILLVANDWRLAGAIGADGVHLAENLARTGINGPCRWWLRRHRKLLSVAAHSPRALMQANRLGADFCLLSPVFPSNTHPGKPGLGPIRFARSSKLCKIPVLALGGVNQHSWRRLPPASAHGAAAIDGLSG
mgnify:CR=1 FL=1